MIYLNNAATSFPKPKEVRDAVAAYLGNPPFHAARTGYDQQPDDVVFACRQSLATLFNIQSPERIVFTSGATEALCLAIFGLELHDAHVVSTLIEHNSVLRPLKTLERDGAIRLTLADCDASGRVDAQALCEQIGPGTKAVIVNHCSNVTGAVTDLRTIGTATREQGIPFIVDASQSAGHIPIDVDAMHIDLLAFTGHKSLYGLQGIGGLFIRNGMHLKPLKVGGTGVRSDDLFQPQTMPMYYEAGTPNLPGIVSLHAGVSFILETGLEQIRKRKEHCVQKMLEQLVKKSGIIVYSSHESKAPPGLFSFNIKNMTPADVGYMLENSFAIIIRSGLHCAPLIHKALHSYPHGSVRVSPSYFTTDDEIAAFLGAIETIYEEVQMDENFGDQTD